jgi:hypothetical protein
MKRFWVLTGIGALGLIALFRWADASAIATAAYNLIENSGSALTMRPTLNFVNGGCSDNPTYNRTDCTVSGGSGSAGGVTSYNGSAPSSAGTTYISVGGSTNNSNALETVVQTPVSATGTASTLYARVALAPGSGNSYVFTFRDNGSDTSLTCTISGASATSCSDTTDTASVTAGDLVDYSIVTAGTSVAGAYLGISLLLPASATANPQFTISNASSTGTTVNMLTKLTGAPSTAIITATTDTGGAIGITTAGAGTSGTATITTAGKISCVFDGATTAGDYVQISSSTAGNCHDTGAATYPSSGQVLGRVLSTNGSGGTYTLDLFPSEIKGGSGGGSVSVSGFYLYDGTNYYIGPQLNIATLPVLGSFSWLTTQGTASAATVKNGIVLTAPAISGDSLHCFGQAIGSDTTLTVALNGNVTLQNFTSLGIAFFESGTGKLVTFGISTALASGAPFQDDLVVQEWNNGTSFNANAFEYASSNAAQNVMDPSFRWYRIQQTGGNLIFLFSYDGQNFVQVYSQSQTTWFTTAADNWCIYANSNNSGGSTTVYNTLYSWKQQ